MRFIQIFHSILFSTFVFITACSSQSDTTKQANNSLPPINTPKDSEDNNNENEEGEEEENNEAVYKNYVYVTQQALNKILVYEANEENDTLTQIQTIDTALTPTDIEVKAESNLLFATNFNSGTVSSYTIDPATGNLSIASIIAETANDNETLFPHFIALHPTKPYLYTAYKRKLEDGTSLNGRVLSYAFDETTGELSKINSRSTKKNPYKPDIDPSGNYLYVPNIGVSSDEDYFISIYSIDDDGMTHYIEHWNIGQNRPIHLDLHKDYPVAYISSYIPEKIKIVEQNEFDGSLTSDSEINLEERPRRLTIHPDGNYLYSVHRTNSNSTNTQVKVFEIDDTELNLNEIQTVNMENQGPIDIATSYDGNYLYTPNLDANSISVFSIQENGLLDLEQEINLVENSLPRSVATARLLQPSD